MNFKMKQKLKLKFFKRKYRLLKILSAQIMKKKETAKIMEFFAIQFDE